MVMFKFIKKNGKQKTNGNGRANGKSNGKKNNGNYLKLKGYLTREDVDRLEEASKRVLKYPKNPAQKFKCGDCGYQWLYASVKCPVCSSEQTARMNS